MTDVSPTEVGSVVLQIVEKTPIVDLHTHLYPPAFGDLLLWGVDETLTYHYLIAEALRRSPIAYDALWNLSTTERADHIWESLFVRTSPVSEATRGVLTCLQILGMESHYPDLNRIRKAFSVWSAEEFVNLIFKKANLEFVVMTNDPFDPKERAVWDREPKIDPRFRAALRVDPLLTDWPRACAVLSDLGYSASVALDEGTCAEIRRFLLTWMERMDPLYMAVSLPPTFRFPSEDETGKLIESCILPAARDRGIPLALMIGVKRGVNPMLRLAGDGVGKAGLQAVENLCASYPDNRFMATMLSREDQHELCVAARKFRNLFPFGCWWFTNVPSIIREITAERIELLGLSFAPQHSDARILDQLLYKWTHSRQIIAEVLIEKYTDLMRTGWPLYTEDIEQDIKDLFADNFKRFIGRT
ncbi:MAG: glucuronate isomerase [bacterium]